MRAGSRILQVHNGGDKGRGRTQFVTVEKKKCRKPKPKPADEPAAPSINSVTFSGSNGECVRINFSCGLCHRQQKFVEDKLKEHECYSYVKEVRWARSNKTCVIEVWRNSIQECSRIDVETAIRALVYQIPIFKR